MTIPKTKVWQTRSWTLFPRARNLLIRFGPPLLPLRPSIWDHEKAKHSRSYSPLSTSPHPFSNTIQFHRRATRLPSLCLQISRWGTILGWIVRRPRRLIR